MGVRLACFVLMATVTPYSWYTWLFALGAAVLPYLAVVVANVSSAATSRRAEDPRRVVEAPRPAEPTNDAAEPGVFRITETRKPEDS
jgi:hypothetical protein